MHVFPYLVCKLKWNLGCSGDKNFQRDHLVQASRPSVSRILGASVANCQGGNIRHYHDRNRTYSWSGVPWCWANLGMGWFERPQAVLCSLLWVLYTSSVPWFQSQSVFTRKVLASRDVLLAFSLLGKDLFILQGPNTKPPVPWFLLDSHDASSQLGCDFYLSLSWKCHSLLLDSNLNFGCLWRPFVWRCAQQRLVNNWMIYLSPLVGRAYTF